MLSKTVNLKLQCNTGINCILLSAFSSSLRVCKQNRAVFPLTFLVEFRVPSLLKQLYQMLKKDVYIMNICHTIFKFHINLVTKYTTAYTKGCMYKRKLTLIRESTKV